MALVKLTWDTLGELYGGIGGAIIDKEIDIAVADIDDRGDDGKVRKVMVCIELEKRENGTIDCRIKAAAKLPVRQTVPTNAEVKRSREGGLQLVFQESNPERVDQPTFPDLDEK